MYGLIFTLLFGLARNEANYMKSKDAIVNNSGDEELCAPADEYYAADED